MTAAASKRGRNNRIRGHNCERKVAKHLRGVGYPDAHTTREELGHDGGRQPGDVVGPVGLIISVKDVEKSAWPSWCAQAEKEANGRPWVVVRRLRGNPDVGAWPCCYRTPTMLRLSKPTLTFAEFLAEFDGAERVCGTCFITFRDDEPTLDYEKRPLCPECEEA